MGEHIFLNGEPTYLRLVLDQGYYSDGLWTAPSKRALLRDIELAKCLGFNGARLHQKVFEPWYFHYADLLGFLVVSEYPDWPGDKTRRWLLPEAYKRMVKAEWRAVVEHLHNHTSIIMWTALNEAGAPLHVRVCSDACMCSSGFRRKPCARRAMLLCLAWTGSILHMIAYGSELRVSVRWVREGWREGTRERENTRGSEGRCAPLGETGGRFLLASGNLGIPVRQRAPHRQGELPWRFTRVIEAY